MFTDRILISRAYQYLLIYRPSNNGRTNPIGLIAIYLVYNIIPGIGTSYLLYIFARNNIYKIINNK